MHPDTYRYCRAVRFWNTPSGRVRRLQLVAIQIAVQFRVWRERDTRISDLATVSVDSSYRVAYFSNPLSARSGRNQ